MKRSISAFTLLEVTIVLVAIGLLVGSILIGTTVLRQSQLMSSKVVIDAYVNAVSNFQQKYNALPGDYPAAVASWGAAAGGSGDNYTSSCYGTAGTGTQTCNGDGDGHVSTTSGTNYENLLFWQHLAIGGFVQGKFTGVGNANGAYDCLPGSNCPKSRLGESGFGIAYLGVTSGSASYFDGIYNHVFVWGGHVTNANPSAGIISPVEALAIDVKYDDGLPATGNIVTFKPAILPACANGSTSSAAYLATTSGAQCSLIFISGF